MRNGQREWDSTHQLRVRPVLLTPRSFKQLGFGPELRRALNVQILNGEVNFRDGFRQMINSIAVNKTFDETKEYLKNRESLRFLFESILVELVALFILVHTETLFDPVESPTIKGIKLDPGFKVFFDWCKTHNIPVVIVSSGMVPIIRAIMENLVGVEDAAKIEIVANEVEYLDNGSWTIKFRHPESGFGHDKSRSTGPYRDLPHRPTLFFCGDGGKWTLDVPSPPSIRDG